MPGSTLATKSFSDGGNSIKSIQNCSYTDSCTLTSTNTITREPPSLQEPPKCHNDRTDVVLFPIFPRGQPQTTASGYLFCDAFPLRLPIAFANITFTGTGVPPNLSTIGKANSEFTVTFPTPAKPGEYTAQAHFTGMCIRFPEFCDYPPGDSNVVTFSVP